MTAHLTLEAITKTQAALAVADRAAGAATSDEIDVKGAEGFYAHIHHTLIGTSLTVKITHSDTSGGSFTDALLDDGVSVMEVVLPIAAGLGRIRVRSSRLKRFVKVVGTLVGTNVTYGIETILAGLHRQPEEADDVDGYDLLV